MGISQSDYIAMIARMDAISKREHGKPLCLAGKEHVQPLKSEAALHEKILDECARRGWIAFHGSMARPTARTMGEPDFQILADQGRVILIEAKSATGKLRPEQAALAAWAAKLGHTIHVVRTLEEFYAVIK